MRRFSVVLVLAALSACKPAEKPAAEPAMAPAPAPAAPAAINLADVAGNWTVKTMREGSDTVMITYTIAATADTTGWMVTLPGRKPMAMMVSTSGDSVMTSMGPYASVLRKGVQVSTNGSFHLVGGKLVGHMTAHYSVKTADSVVALRTEGEKMP